MMIRVKNEARELIGEGSDGTELFGGDITMNGELLHMAELVAYGNEYIKTSGNSSYTESSSYVAKVQFIKKQEVTSQGIMQKIFNKHKNNNGLVASSIQEWFKYLKTSGCIGLELVLNENRKEDHVISVFANGVSGWCINCIFYSHSEFWVRNWQVDNSSGQTKWNINYYGVSGRLFRCCVKPDDLLSLKKRFDSILERIGIFAEIIGVAEWKKFFDKGRESLKANPADKKAVLPNSYSIEAKQLMLAIYNSWVFGGMGSWNDSPPYCAHEIGKEEKYNQLTSELYSVMLECIQASVNSLIA